MSAGDKMKLGITMFATDVSCSVIDLARDAEARGFYSLYLPEHTHIPTSRTTPPPTGEDVLAEEYKRTVDPFVALGAAAAVTETIRLGTGIALVAQRDPIVLAKEVATLDHISNGRAILGIGFGWNREELADHGVAFADRRAVVRERVRAMQALWASDEAGFDGEHVRISSSWSWPKPVQRPGVPVLLGGAAGPKLFAHIAEYCDGWIPIGGAGISAALPKLYEALAAVGRSADSVSIVPFGTLPDEGKLAYYADLGVREVVLRIPSVPRDEVLPILDQFAKYL
jgi:probable F420-dependent oxidoreductase